MIASLSTETKILGIEYFPKQVSRDNKSFIPFECKLQIREVIACTNGIYFANCQNTV